MKTTTLGLVVLLFVLSACQSTRSNEELSETLSKFNKAFETGDLDYLDQHTKDTYLHTNGSSKSFDKTAWFNYLKNRSADIKSGKIKMELYEMTEISMQQYGNSALVTGKVRTKGINNSEPFDRELRVTHYWVLEEGLWKRAGFHDTRIK